MADDPKPRSSRELTAVERPRSSKTGDPITPMSISDPTIGREAGDGEGDPDGFTPGEVVAARYRILELLGAGGMGAVYRARDLTLGADVAIKRLDPGLAEDAGRVDYFRNEVLLARRVTHANVCRLHDIVEDEGGWFITMEYVEGETLSERIRREEPLELDFVLRVIRDVTSGLAAAHEVGVVHRDLKPGNVLLAADGGRAVIADFGIAVEVNQLGRAVVDRAGTRGYMSPEQAAGGDIDARTDVFALGVLAHRMLAGELPPVAPTTVAHTEESEPPTPVPDSIPPALASIIARCLRRDPDDRYADAGELLEALGAIDRPPERRRSRLPLFAGGVVAIGALAAAATFALRPSEAALQLAAPRQVVIASVDASAIDGPRGQWVGQAIGRRLVNELDDAWAQPARLAGDPGPPVHGIDASVEVAVREGPRGLVASLSIDGADPIEIGGESLQELVESAALELVNAAIPAGLRRPSAIDLASAGGSDAEAWRLWRRSQRASVRQLWQRARQLSKAAIDRDPTFVAGNIEHAWTFSGGDPRSVPFIEAAIAAASSRLDLGWSLAVDFCRVALTGDKAKVDRAMKAALAADLPYRHRWYFFHRANYAEWYDGARDDALPHLEQLEAGFPRSAGAPKLLANHYLGRDDREAREQALRHARIAVDRAPDDVASRADLARALLWMNEHSAALEQLAIIEAAGEREKLEAVAGGEETNSLFDLYMALDDHAGADRAARRLETGTVNDQGHAHQGRALLRLYRGDHQGGLERFERAIARFDEARTGEFMTVSRRKLASVAFALDRRDLVRRMVEEMGRNTPAYYSVIAAITRARDGDRRALDQAEAMVAGFSDRHTEKAFLGVILAAERGDWQRVLELEDGSVRWRRHLPARYLLGIAREKTGDKAMAATHHERLAYHRYGWSNPIWTNRSLLEAARLRAELGDTEKARTHYERYLERLDRAPPSHAGVAAARRGLAKLGD